MSLSIAKLVVAIELSGQFNIDKSILYHGSYSRVEHWKILEETFGTRLLRGNFIVKTRLGNGTYVPSKLITADVGQTLAQIAGRLGV